MSRRVLVTGSSKGIGKAIALKLAKDGFDISLHCRSGIEAAEQVKSEIIALGVNVDILQFDVVDRESAKAILGGYVERHGAFYGVVCNAGITADTVFPAMTDEEWDSVIHTNLDGFYNVLHPLVKVGVLSLCHQCLALLVTVDKLIIVHQKRVLLALRKLLLSSLQSEK